MSHGVVGDRSTVADCEQVIGAQAAVIKKGQDTQAAAASSQKNIEGQKVKATSDQAGAKKAAENSAAGGDAQSTVNEEIMMKGLGEITGASGIAECIGVASDMLSDTSDQVTGMGLKGGQDMFAPKFANSIQMPPKADLLFGANNASSSLTGKTSNFFGDDMAIAGAEAESAAVSQLNNQCTHEVGKALALSGAAHAKKSELLSEQRQHLQMGGMAPGGGTANANRAPQAQVPKGMAYNNDKFANGPSCTIRDEDLV